MSTLPRAIAIIDAKLEYSEYPFRELAGVGIAYKLLQALYHSDKRKRYLSKLLDLVALGSVADMVPLISENRYLVKEGIRSLNKTKRLGIQELIKTSKLEAGKLDTRSISWYLGPRINAASRLGDATISYQLLRTSSAQEANELSMELEETNAERQNHTKETIEKAKVKLEDKLHLPILIDSDEDYALGVIGLVAGKLVDEFHKPAILISLGEDSCQGSCRSIDEFNLVKNLESCTDLLETFGGHPLAAGFTVKKENLAALNDRMLEQAQEQLSKIDLRPAITVDAEVPFSTLTGTVLSMIQQMEPFGQGNPTPVLLTKNVKVLDCYNFGNSNNYLSFKLQHGTTIWQAVDFHSKTKRADIAPYIDIIYSLEKRRWNGEETLRLNLLDFSPASS